MTDNDRTLFRNQLVTVLTAFSVANPTYCRRVFRARPSSSPDAPFIYIESVRARVHHDMQTRTTTFTGLSFVLVFKSGPNDETALLMDQAVDALIDYLTLYPQLGSTRGIWSDLEITDEDAPLGDYDFPGVRFNFPDISVTVGRST